MGEAPPKYQILFSLSLSLSLPPSPSLPLSLSPSLSPSLPLSLSRSLSLSLSLSLPLPLTLPLPLSLSPLSLSRQGDVLHSAFVVDFNHCKLNGYEGLYCLAPFYRLIVVRIVSNDIHCCGYLAGNANEEGMAE